jgi:hypothetical protein
MPTFNSPLPKVACTDALGSRVQDLRFRHPDPAVANALITWIASSRKARPECGRRATDGESYRVPAFPATTWITLEPSSRRFSCRSNRSVLPKLPRCLKAVRKELTRDAGYRFLAAAAAGPGLRLTCIHESR